MKIIMMFSLLPSIGDIDDNDNLAEDYYSLARKCNATSMNTGFDFDGQQHYHPLSAGPINSFGKTALSPPDDDAHLASNSNFKSK